MRVLDPTANFWDELGYWTDVSEHGYHIGGWREQFRHLADEDSLAELLAPSGKQTATIVPCPRRNGCPFCMHMRVLRQTEEKHVGICPKRRFDPVALVPEELRLMNFRYDLLHERVSRVLPVQADVRPGNAPRTWLLGGLHFGTRKRCRVYISYLMPGYMLECCGYLMAVERSPCIVLSPHCGKVREKLKTTLNALPVAFIPVQEVVAVDRFCRMSLIRPLHPVFAEYAKNETAESRTAFGFPVPTGIGWRDIRIHFLDMHTVTCCVGSSHLTFGYRDMGMRNSRTGEPDMSWKLLLYLAENDGIFRPGMDGLRISQRDKQKKSRLSSALKLFFNLDAEPFEFDCGRSSYVCLFKISPETRSTSYHRRLRKQ